MFRVSWSLRNVVDTNDKSTNGAVVEQYLIHKYIEHNDFYSEYNLKKRIFKRLGELVLEKTREVPKMM